LCYVNSNTLDHGLANCSTRTTTGTPAIVYWYDALIRMKHKQHRQCMVNVNLKCFRATVVTVEKQ